MAHSGKLQSDTAISGDVPQSTVTNTKIELCLNSWLQNSERGDTDFDRVVYERTPEDCVAPKIWVKPFSEYYDVRTELNLVPTTTMEISCMITLTSSVNYSSHQRHLSSQPQGSVRGTDWVCKRKRGHRTYTGLQSWGELSLEHYDINVARRWQKNSINKYHKRW